MMASKATWKARAKAYESTGAYWIRTYNEQCELTDEKEEQINRLIDAMRAHGCPIDEVQRILDGAPEPKYQLTVEGRDDVVLYVEGERKEVWRKVAEVWATEPRSLVEHDDGHRGLCYALPTHSHVARQKDLGIFNGKVLVETVAW
jgi:hypothetical protein